MVENRYSNTYQMARSLMQDRREPDSGIIVYLGIEIFFYVSFMTTLWILSWDTPFLLDLLIFSLFTLGLSSAFRNSYPLSKRSVDRAYYTIGIVAVVFFSIDTEDERSFSILAHDNLNEIFHLKTGIEQLKFAGEVARTMSTCPECLERAIQAQLGKFVYLPRESLPALMAPNCNRPSHFEGLLQSFFHLKFDPGNTEILRSVRSRCEDAWDTEILNVGLDPIRYDVDVVKKIHWYLPLLVEDLINMDSRFQLDKLRFGKLIFVLLDHEGKIRDTEKILADIEFLSDELENMVQDRIRRLDHRETDMESDSLVSLLILNVWPFVIISLLGLKLARPD